jgi:hypothetical protein
MLLSSQERAGKSHRQQQWNANSSNASHVAGELGKLTGKGVAPSRPLGSRIRALVHAMQARHGVASKHGIQSSVRGEVRRGVIILDWMAMLLSRISCFNLCFVVVLGV